MEKYGNGHMLIEFCVGSDKSCEGCCLGKMKAANFIYRHMKYLSLLYCVLQTCMMSNGKRQVEILLCFNYAYMHVTV